MPGVPADIDVQAAARAAQALLDTRIAAVRTLAQARQATNVKVGELQAAERKDTAAYRAALREGWTEEELKKVGFDSPGRRSDGPPRQRRVARTTRAAQASPRPST